MLYRSFLYLDGNAIRSTRGIYNHPVRNSLDDQRSTLTTFYSILRVEAAEIFYADSNGFSELQSGLGTLKAPDGAYIFQAIALIVLW